MKRHKNKTKAAPPEFLEHEELTELVRYIEQTEGFLKLYKASYEAKKDSLSRLYARRYVKKHHSNLAIGQVYKANIPRFSYLKIIDFVFLKDYTHRYILNFDFVTDTGEFITFPLDQLSRISHAWCYSNGVEREIHERTYVLIYPMAAINIAAIL